MELELLEKMLNRRSVRTYNGEAIPRKKLDLIIQAGLLAPSGRGLKPWEFIVVKDKAMLQKLSRSENPAPECWRAQTVPSSS